jgi:hypothetical protein
LRYGLINTNLIGCGLTLLFNLERLIFHRLLFSGHVLLLGRHILPLGLSLL